MQEFWATATVHHHSIRFNMDNKKYIVNLEYFREMLHICPRLTGHTFDELPFEEEILAFLRFLRHSGEIRRLTDRLYHKRNVDFTYLLWEDFVYQVQHKDAKKSNEMYYPRFTKELHHQRLKQVFGAKSSFDTTITPPPTAAAGTRLSTFAKGKQPGKASKAKSLTVLFEVAMTEVEQLKLATKRSLQQTHISQASGSGADEGTGIIPGVPDVPTEEMMKIKMMMIKKKGMMMTIKRKVMMMIKILIKKVKNSSIPEETKDEESFDPIAKTPKNSVDEGNDEENVGREEGQDEKDDEDELYGYVSINLEGRVVQMADVHTTQEFEDSHVTLTLMDVQTPTTVAPLPLSAPTLTPSTIATISTVPQAPTPSTTALSTLLYMDQRMNEAVKTVNEQLEAEFLTRSSNSSKTSYVVAADLSEMELKKILIEKMEGNKSILRSNEQRNLYKALVKAYESDKFILEAYGDTVTLKRRRDDDADKDEEPFAGSDRGSKRRRKGKEPESTSALKDKATKTTGKSTQGPPHPEFETGAADDQPIAETSQHLEWFSQQKKPPTPDRDWNKTLPATHGSIQSWISELAKQTDSRSSFNELMDTPVDFSAFLMNRLKVATLTPELLARPTYELMKGEFARDVYSKRRIIAVTKLKIVEWHNYKHLDWITVRRDDGKLYKFKEGDFKRLRIQDTEDMLMLLVQGKLTNLTVKERFAFNVSLRMFTRSIVIQRRVEDLQLGRKEAYTAYSNPRGFIYQNKDKHNRLMRIDELHQFTDGTLTDVRTALDDHLKGIRMKYLPQPIWRKSDKERAAAMIQAIDKQLKTRRIMRSLERFVGGRLYEGDFRILQRTPGPKGSTQGYPLASVEVFRYDKRSKSKNMGIVPTEMELILEHTQQGISHEVSKPVNTYAIRKTKLLSGIEDSHHVPSDAMHNPSQPLKVRKTLFQNSRRYTHFYRLSHSELVGIEKEALSSSLRSLN
nr:hypothetical protein [Tanacetum cinerariifolium]